MNFSLLKELVAIPGISGDESKIKDFLIDYIERAKCTFKVEPKIIADKEFQDNIILVFGKPKTAIFAHIDTVGFTVGYEKNLIKVGSPKVADDYKLIGRDDKGSVETEMMLLEDENEKVTINYVFEREIERGTCLNFPPNFRQNETYIQSPYLDNRLGVWVALKVAKTLENGVIVFSTYEEHGGNSVGYIARYLREKYGINQALISDITWVTEGVKHGAGVAISMRDHFIPRKKYLNRIIEIAKNSNIPFQLEVESSGGSDGGLLQKSDVLFDWCFIGAPEDNVHSPQEKVFIKDIASMIAMYELLMKEL
jgi:putative aminopeptidase FrvX